MKYEYGLVRDARLGLGLVAQEERGEVLGWLTGGWIGGFGSGARGSARPNLTPQLMSFERILPTPCRGWIDYLRARTR